MVDSSKSGPLFSLRANSQNRLRGIFIDVKEKSKGAMCFILVVDQTTLRFISSYFKMMELMEMGVTAIEKLELKRKKFPKMNAIYFLSPNQTSLNLLLEDYANKKDPQYGQVHLFFSNKLAPEMLKQIGTCEGIISRIANLKEFNQDFLCTEDNIFSCDMPEALPVLFSKRNTQEGEKMIDDIANKLCTLLPSFQKFHEVEIAFNDADNQISKAISQKLEKKILEYFEKLEKSQKEGAEDSPLDKDSGKITFVILDRSVDPLTPVLHDFFYQPMIYDLLQIENDVVEYEEEDKKSGKLQKKKALLTDNDDLFQRYKYCHIAEVLDGIPNEFQTFIKNNSTAKLQQGQLSNLDLNAISNIVKTMPQYNELLSKYTMHMKLIEQSWQLFEQKDLKEVGELEQSLATGVDREGKSTNDTKLLSSVGARLNSTKLSDEDKLRLIMIVTMSMEMVARDREALTKNLSEKSESVIQKLGWLGIKALKTEGKSKGKTSKKVTDNIKNLAKSKLSSATLDLCRHTPMTETALESILVALKKNDVQESKAIKMRSLCINKSASSSSNAKSLKKNNKLNFKMGANKEDEWETVKNSQKLVVFIPGGISFSEIRAFRGIADFPENMFLILGSTHLISPSKYIQGISEMRTANESGL